MRLAATAGFAGDDIAAKGIIDHFFAGFASLTETNEDQAPLRSLPFKPNSPQFDSG